MICFRTSGPDCIMTIASLHTAVYPYKNAFNKTMARSGKLCFELANFMSVYIQQISHLHNFATFQFL